jgi:hypothetical protein
MEFCSLTGTRKVCTKTLKKKREKRRRVTEICKVSSNVKANVVI